MRLLFCVGSLLGGYRSHSFSSKGVLGRSSKFQGIRVDEREGLFFSRKSTTLFANDYSRDSDSDVYDTWQPNDVKSDLEKLEMAVIKSRAEGRLREKERYALLDTIASGRREIVPDAMNYFTASLLFVSWMVATSLKTPTKTPCHRFTTILGNLLGIHFWSIVVVSPIVTYLSLKRHLRRLPIQGDEEGQLNTIRQGKTYINSPLYLLEYWISSTLPTLVYTITGFMISSSKEFQYGPLFTCLQILTRLGAAASVHQYPKLLYEISRENQPRPIPKHTFALQRLIKRMMVILPLAFALDTGKLIHQLGHHSLQKYSRTALLMLGLTLFSPLCHLAAFGKIVKIGKIPAVSLSQLKKPESIDGDKWRWSLSWRKPRRLTSVLYKCFLFLTIGLVSESDKMRDLTHSRSQSTGQIGWTRRGENDATMGGNYQFENEILRLLSAENKNGLLKREDCLVKAEEEKRKEHELDYDNGSFHDPLGIAVSKTLDLGLSFAYDHSVPLRKSDGEPSIYRLRARAAKSAVKRVQYLHNPERASAILDAISDPIVRIRKCQELRTEARKEMEYLRAQLLALAPTYSGVLPEGIENSNIMAIKRSDVVRNFAEPRNLTAREGEKPDLQRKFLQKEFGASIKDAEEAFGVGVEDVEKEFGASIRDAEEAFGVGVEDVEKEFGVRTKDIEENFIRMEYDEADESEDEGTGNDFPSGSSSVDSTDPADGAGEIFVI